MNMNKKEEWGYRCVTLQGRLDEIEKALECKLYNAALALALTVPDICGKVEFKPKNQKETKGTYIKWFDTYIRDFYTPNMYRGKIHEAHRSMTGEMCYYLRCSFLHAGDDSIRDSWQGFITDEENEDYTNVSFVLQLSVDFEGVECSSQELESRDYLVHINVIELCKRICKAARDTIKRFPDDYKDDKYTTTLYSSFWWVKDRDEFMD